MIEMAWELNISYFIYPKDSTWDSIMNVDSNGVPRSQKIIQQLIWSLPHVVIGTYLTLGRKIDEES